MKEEPYKNREIDEKFNDIMKELKEIKIQTTKHNGRMQKMERILLIVGTATGVLLVTNGSTLLTFLQTII